MYSYCIASYVDFYCFLIYIEIDIAIDMFTNLTNNL